MTAGPVGMVPLIRAAFIVGIDDFRALYTWRTWLFGWLLRVTFQVLFFALMGRYLGKPEEVAFLVVGGAAAVSLLETMSILIFSSFDRLFGVLPLLVAAPAEYFLVVLARNVFNCVLMGTCSASVTLFFCARVVGVRLNYPAAILAVALIAMGATCTYLFAIFLSAVVAKARSGRWVVLNVGYMVLTAICGFLIPVGFWPAPVGWLAQILPYTHALAALRGLVLGSLPASTIARDAALELVAITGWFTAARVAFGISVERARRDGSIDLTAG